MSSGSAETKVIMASSAIRFIAALGLLNLVWEVAQLPLYTIWRDGTWDEIIFAVAHCTAGDVLIGLFSAGGAFFLAGMRWPQEARSRLIFITCFLAFGLTYTVFSEWLNVAVRKSWAYSTLMPVIPPLDTGLSPILQWIAVPMVAFRLALRK